MGNIKESLKKGLAIDGAVGAALVDFASGVCLGSRGGQDLDMELAGAAITDVVRAKKNILANMGLDETIDEVIVTLDDHYHLIQSFEQHDGIFSYLILDRARCSLPIARTHLRAIDRALTLDRAR
jgi:hypothetical protein